MNKQTIGTGIITSGLPNCVTVLLGIDHVTVSGIHTDKKRVKENPSPHSRSVRK